MFSVPSSNGIFICNDAALFYISFLLLFPSSFFYTDTFESFELLQIWNFFFLGVPSILCICIPFFLELFTFLTVPKYFAPDWIRNVGRGEYRRNILHYLVLIRLLPKKLDEGFTKGPPHTPPPPAAHSALLLILFQSLISAELNSIL